MEVTYDLSGDPGVRVAIGPGVLLEDCFLQSVRVADEVAPLDHDVDYGRSQLRTVCDDGQSSHRCTLP